MKSFVMPTPHLQTLRAPTGALLLSALCFAVALGAAWYSAIGRVQAAVLVALPVAAAFALLFRHVRNEDQVARLEAALCREQHARSEADHALAEADLLLARLTARTRPGIVDPAAQLATVHAELAQIQRHVGAGDPHLALRIELLCLRVERAVASLRNTGRAAESG
jgi:hypothetical protein